MHMRSLKEQLLIRAEEETPSLRVQLEGYAMDGWDSELRPDAENHALRASARWELSPSNADLRLVVRPNMSVAEIVHLLDKMKKWIEANPEQLSDLLTAEAERAACLCHEEEEELAYH